MPEALVQMPIETTDGTFVATYSRLGLAALDFPSRTAREIKTEAASSQVGSWHAITSNALKNILSGKEPSAWPPLDLSIGTHFQREVWNALRTIALGSTLSYGEVARQIGRPNAVRAVGAACGANPIPVLVPCHRVLAAHGRIGGFSGGLDWKRRLLERERKVEGCFC